MGRNISLFLTLSIGLFLLINLTFPPFTDVLLSRPMDGAVNGLAAGQVSGVVFLAVEMLVLVILAFLLSWCFRQLVEMTDSAGACRLVLGAGALITTGHLLILIWGGFDTGNRNMLLQRVVLSIWVVAVCSTVVNAIFRHGPEPDSRLGTAGFGA